MLTDINIRLAQRFAHHPGVILWHLSNEYSGECHCPLCQGAFRRWLQRRYQSLDALNRVWCTAFWGHVYTDWSQVESPSPLGDTTLHGLQLDWRRFCCDQTLDFIRCERDAIHSVRPDAPITVNMMYYTYGMNYFKFADAVDVVSWDSYPVWHNEDNGAVAADTAMYHDLMRSIKHQPFLLMESTPSVSNWQPVSRQNTLEALNAVCGTATLSEVAVVFDWENRWAADEAQGPFNSCSGYKETVKAHYMGLWRQGVNIDFIDMEGSLDGYRLVVAPMLYLLRGGMAEKLRQFVEAGGTVLSGPYSGVVDENDRCYRDGTPHDLLDVFGLRTVELDGHGAGAAYYLCAEMNPEFYADLYSRLIALCGIEPLLSVSPPPGIDVSKRSGNGVDYLFIQNFTETDCPLDFGKLWENGWELLYGSDQSGTVTGYGTVVLSKNRQKDETGGLLR